MKLLLFLCFDLLSTQDMDMEAPSGGMEIKDSDTVVSPVQFPGIVNPSIFIQNRQAAPIFPLMESPPINMNLQVDGLENYYKPQRKVYYQRYNLEHINELGSLVDE